MMDAIVFRINADGSVVAVSLSGVEEALDLRSFGRLTVRRASHVHFGEATQTWGWRSTDGERSGSGFPTRLAAVAHEIRTLSGSR
jgi:hypothetical protein